MRWLSLTVLAMSVLPTLHACAPAIYLVNQTGAREQATAAGLDARDRADLDAGNLTAIRTRYADRAPADLSTTQLGLLCDVLLKYQELGRAQDCLNAAAARVAREPAAHAGRLGRALNGKRAVLALAVGRPQEAMDLTADDTSEGGRYVHALAAIRTRQPAPARQLAGRLRFAYQQPTPILHYAASLYAALDDCAQARKVLEDPQGRLLTDYGLSSHPDLLGGTVGTAPFRLDVFDEFDFGLFSKVSFAPAANPYVEYLAAHCYLETGDIEQARRRLDTVLAYPGIDAYRDVIWRALHDRATIARRAGDLATAEPLLRRSIDVIETTRSSANSEAIRIAVAGDRQAPYRALVDVLVPRGKVTEALVVAERAHSRVLVELLAMRYRFGGGTVRGSADHLVAELDRAAGELAFASAQPGTLDRRRADVAARQTALQVQARDVADLVTVEPVNWQAVQSNLGPREAALVFSPGLPDWHVFTVTAAAITSHRVPASEVGRPAVTFHKALLQLDPVAWRAPARALYASLIAPAVSGLNVDTLTIVPSDELYYIPFAALDDGQALLIDRYTLRSVPNLGLISRNASGASSGGALVIGNPQKGNPELSLEFAEAEARQVAAMVTDPRLLIGQGATIGQFRALAPGRGLVHFAGHADLDAGRPLDARLMFSSPDGRPDPLTSDQLFDLRMSASLVFLSACSTGVSIAHGQEIMGLQRGFFFAGASTAVTTLWAVNDKSTAWPVRAFYKEWKQGRSPAETLRRAQIATRAEFPLPYYWAGFVATNVGRP